MTQRLWLLMLLLKNLCWGLKIFTMAMGHWEQHWQLFHNHLLVSRNEEDQFYNLRAIRSLGDIYCTQLNSLRLWVLKESKPFRPMKYRVCPLGPGSGHLQMLCQMSRFTRMIDQRNSSPHQNFPKPRNSQCLTADIPRERAEISQDTGKALFLWMQPAGWF